MATISLPNTFSPNTTILSASVNSNFTTIYNDYNGNITNANIASGAAIAHSKLAGFIGCRVYNSADLSANTATDTAMTFNSERFDTDTMHSTSTNTGRITFTTAGYYMCGGQVNWENNATGYRRLRIRLNGATVLASVHALNIGGADALDQIVVTGYQFSASDYIELMGYQNSGATLTIDAQGNFSPEFWALKITAQ